MITPTDDYTHPLGPERNFNESMYFQFHDPAQQICGFLRLANRPNEGRGERTVCLYLPDGSVAFGFERPPVTTNEAMSAGGLDVSVIEPMRDVRVRFDGAVRLLAEPRAMVDPKAALSGSPIADCHVALHWAAAAPPHEQTFEADGESFAPNHYEQLAAVTGEVTLGDDTMTISGHGLRDHSWGPRSWQAPWFYRWLHGCTDGFGFMVAYFGDPDGASRRGGFIFEDGQTHVLDGVAIATVRDDDGYQDSVTVTAQSGRREWKLLGRAISSIPLRHNGANGEPSTRIAESAMRWRTETGVEMYGMAEYLDQLCDGQPAGLLV